MSDEEQGEKPDSKAIDPNLVSMLPCPQQDHKLTYRKGYMGWT